MSFWGARALGSRALTTAAGAHIVAGKPTEIILGADLQLSQAALGADAQGRVSLMVAVGASSPVVLCNLIGGKLEQTRLNLEIPAFEEVVFTVNGKGSVDLVGTLFAVDQDEEDEDDEEILSEDDEEIESGDDDSEEVDGSFSSVSSNEANEAIMKALEKRGGNKALEAAMSAAKPSAPAAAAAAKAASKPAAAAAKPAAAAAESKKRPAEDEKKSAPPEKKAATEASAAKKKPEAAAPQAKKPAAEEKKPAAAEASGPAKTITLDGGLKFTDEVVGKGPMAKRGDKVAVHYVGKLKNGKVFDKGDFSFVIGRGQVIQGWDMGVPGMKVGGKRKLVIPAPLAYGKQSPSPDIPPNSELHFEVVLKNVNGPGKKEKKGGKHQPPPPEIF